jgi:hypothetical protein
MSPERMPLSQAEQQAQLMGGIIGGVVGLIMIAVGLAVMIFVCLKLKQALERVPAAHRKMEPNQVFLFFIPIFNLFWIFMLVTKIPDSLKSYFDSVGNFGVKDCGKTLGLIWAIGSLVSVVPFLGCLTSIGALVCLVMFVLRVTELSKQIPSISSGATPPEVV